MSQKFKTAKKIIISVLMLILLQVNVATAENNTPDFDDVKTTDWFYNDVKEARKLGLVGGVGNNRYAPNEIISYAQYLTVTVRLVDPGIDNKPTTGNWYDKYIQRARELGVVDKNEVVDPIKAIPREEMMKYTCKALGIEPYDGNEIIFQDVESEDAAYINAAYKEYLTEGTAILGKDKRRFGFGETATRAQLAAMALRIKEYKDDPIAYKEKAAAERQQKEATKLGIALLDIDDENLWHMAASYGSFDIVENYKYADRTFKKAVTVLMEENSIFPGGEVYMVIKNPGKKYKTLFLDAWIERVSSSGLGFFCVMEPLNISLELQDLSGIPAGEVKSFEVDISEHEEIWIYTGLNPGSKVGFANVLVK
jgi:hypothetical protein